MLNCCLSGVCSGESPVRPHCSKDAADSRVTLDYASSSHYISMFDPFSLSANSNSLSVLLPSAVSAFAVPHRGSANFFDLLDIAGFWRGLDRLGITSAAAVGSVGVAVAEGGFRVIGGVPT